MREIPKSEEPEQISEISDSIIELPGDKEKVEKLLRKLEEYDSRKEKEEENGGKESLHAMYKRVILGELIREGHVNLNDMAKKLSEVHGGIKREDFDDAAATILLYLELGRASGGTGLR